MAKNKFKNPVIDTYRGREIRQYNTLRIRVTAREYKQFIDAKIDMGLSERELIEYSGMPCDHCRNVEVVSFNKRDDEIKIKRGILCNNR